MNVSADGNIILEISDKFKGKGLSHVIDYELDNLLGQDITLTKDEWNSVFTLVKQGQVTTNQDQFGTNDTDINNNKHYQVTLNQKYEIKKDVWTKIVEIAKKHVSPKNVSVQPNVLSAGTSITPSGTNEIDAILKNGPESDIHGTQGQNDILEIKKILETAKFDINNVDLEFIKDLAKKYHVMQAVNPNITEEELNKRIINYANAKKFNKFEFGSEAGTINENLSTKASEVKTNLSDLRAAYLEMGAEYVELFDQDGNGEIGLHEMFFNDLVEYYQNEKRLDANTARKYAIEVVKEYKDFNTEVSYDNIESKDLYKATLFNNALLKMKNLDIDNKGTVSAEESATFLYGMAHINDNSNKISSDESVWANLIIQTRGMTKEQIMETLNFDEETADKLIAEQNKFFNYRNNQYKSFIVDGKIPQ